MAQQRRIIKLHDTIGDITFCKSNDDYLAHEKGGVFKECILNDSPFQRT